MSPCGDFSFLTEIAYTTQMLKTPLFWNAFWVLVAIGVLHNIALKLHLYYDWLWFDNVLHFLGGAWIATLVIWFFFFSGLVTTRPIRLVSFVGIIAAGVLLIGTAWEIYEYAFDIAVGEGERYVVDTLFDFLMAYIGAGIVAYLCYKKYHQTLIA